jgi:exopolysaccharide production protein ExoQ
MLCIVLVVGLLCIERKRNPEASLALWIPTIWVLISGSRALGAWFLTIQYNPDSGLSVEQTQAGSPLDQLALGILIVLAMAVIFRRGVARVVVLKDNFYLLLVFTYMGLSILWSDFPTVSLKRWVKVAGVIVMALVVLSETKPLNALESVFRRSAYILIPFSIVLIKYFPEFGVAYGRWDGQQMWTGVTTHKNVLGQLCAFSAFFLIWVLSREWRAGGQFKPKLETLADAMVLAMGFFLLGGTTGSYSATSIAILSAGVLILTLSYYNKRLARFMASHLRGFAVASVSIVLLLHSTAVALAAWAFGRDETLTDRTAIWDVLLEVASNNAIVGVGYGGFWGLSADIYSKVLVGQGHNGYLDVYLELGVIGLILLAAFLLAFCGRVQREMSHSFDWGVFGICILFMALLYNQSESSFLQTGFLWTNMVLISVAFSEPCLIKSRSLHRTRSVQSAIS